MNLRQVRRILEDAVLAPQDDPDDVVFFVDHALNCVRSTPSQFVQPDVLAGFWQQALDITDRWDWAALPPQLAGHYWWQHDEWQPVKELLARARDLLPAVSPAERGELDRQAGRTSR